MAEQTLGESRVRLDFNPSGSGIVRLFKIRSAESIDELEVMKQLKPGDLVSPEKARLCSLAQTAYEEAAMWAVKAATYGT